MTEELPIWTFNIGAAAINYHVRAHDAAEAYRVAVAWCEKTSRRKPAAVQPFIVAGPEILNDGKAAAAIPAEAPAPLPSPVAATSAVNAHR